MNQTFTISIRACHIEDFDAVVSLLRQLWPDKPLNPASLQTIFNEALVSDSKAYLCATDGKRVIGFGSLTIKNNLWPEGHLGYVDELVVDTFSITLISNGHRLTKSSEK
jgi:hypothetical protein